MLPIIHTLTDSEIRSACKERIEALEHWLRRLIDDLLSQAYGDYFEYEDTLGNRLIKKRLAEQIEERRQKEPLRYPRKIDAVLLDDAIDIVCNPRLFKTHFRQALSLAFPDGENEARTFLTRLLPPRNHLAHANSISIRQAEQVICYANDVIDCLKSHYRNIGMHTTYNVPLILKIIDSFGNTFTRGQFQEFPGGGILKVYYDATVNDLHIGDTLTLEVEVDPTFDPSTYNLEWSVNVGLPLDNPTSAKIVIPITIRNVSEKFFVYCKLASTREWHRLSSGHDDILGLGFRVIPPA